MTDTTDIAALREALCKLKSVEGLRTLAAESIDQLEAERQRADAVCHDIRIQANDLKSAQTVNKVLQAEIAALKGDQVPVGVWCIQEVTDDDGSLSRTEFLSVTDGVKIPKDAPLFTATQKPVVLPEYRCSPDMHTKQYYETVGFNRGLDACKAAIEAAGGKVAE